MIRVGIVGLGYWGPNLVRTFSELEHCKVTMVCDQDAGQLLRIRNRYPHVRVTLDSHELMSREFVDAVVIATPTRTHYALATAALSCGLHTFVEKPLATSTAECRALIDLACQEHCLLFVGHVFLHSAPVKKLRELVQAGEFGEICYLSGKRLNLGPVRRDVSSLFDLATHDISIILYLLQQQPEWVSCAGLAHLNPDLHDVCNLTMQFANNRIGLVHVSWLDPKKERILTVVGDRKMAVYDDLAPEKIKIYDKGIQAPKHTDGDFASFQYSYRYGDSFCPWLNETEPLKAECADFIRCIVEGDLPVTDGENGYQVVQVLEAAEESMLRRGEPVELESVSPPAPSAFSKVLPS